MDDIYVYSVRLPDKIDELVTPCIGGYTVWLSDRLDDAHRLRAYNHAIQHIKNRDFERADVQEIETNANRKEV